jgi:hypothetical protein
MKLAIAAVALSALSWALPCAGQSLRINEFLPGPARDWDGSGTFSSRDDEWVEVVNTSDAPVILDGWFLTDGDSLPRYAFQGMLDPGGHVLISGRDAYDWERANGRPAFGLSLANGGDAVMLWRSEGGDTVLVDAHEYRSHEAAADRSIGRLPDGGDEWVLFDGLNPYTGTIPPPGNGCSPTPGVSNTCRSTPVRSASWGAVRRLYR